MAASVHAPSGRARDCSTYAVGVASDAATGACQRTTSARSRALAVTAVGTAGITATAVAVKVSGDPARPAAVACSVWLPRAVPTVQAPTVARPAVFVETTPPVTDPPPPVTVKVTGTPDTALPAASRTTTLGRVDTAVPTVADCACAEAAAICVAGPAAVSVSPAASAEVSPAALKRSV